jgi:ribosome-associated protein
MAVKKNKPASAKKILGAVFAGLSELKAHEVVEIDLRKLPNVFADYFVIAHGTSHTHVAAISDSVERLVQQNCKMKPSHVEGLRNAQWVLLDFTDVVVHVFDEPTRRLFALEELWSDAKTRKITDI